MLYRTRPAHKLWMYQTALIFYSSPPCDGSRQSLLEVVDTTHGTQQPHLSHKHTRRVRVRERNQGNNWICSSVLRYRSYYCDHPHSRATTLGKPGMLVLTAIRERTTIAMLNTRRRWCAVTEVLRGWDADKDTRMNGNGFVRERR